MKKYNKTESKKSLREELYYGINALYYCNNPLSKINYPGGYEIEDESNHLHLFWDKYYNMESYEYWSTDMRYFRNKKIEEIINPHPKIGDLLKNNFGDTKNF